MSDTVKSHQELSMKYHLRSRVHPDAIPPSDQKRFDIFLLDTGWNSSVARLVREQVPVIFRYHPQDSLYILSKEQSLSIIKRDPELIGKDPIILVYDLFGSSAGGSKNYRGFRLNLGLIRHAEQALARLQDFVRFIVVHRQTADIEREVNRELHRDGLQGMLKILTETTTELL